MHSYSFSCPIDPPLPLLLDLLALTPQPPSPHSYTRASAPSSSARFSVSYALRPRVRPPASSCLPPHPLPRTFHISRSYAASSPPSFLRSFFVATCLQYRYFTRHSSTFPLDYMHVHLTTVCFSLMLVSESYIFLVASNKFFGWNDSRVLRLNFILAYPGLLIIHDAVCIACQFFLSSERGSLSSCRAACHEILNCKQSRNKICAVL